MLESNDIVNIVITATNNCTKILSASEIKENYKELDWGKNGVGDRWAKKKFNYTVIYKNKNKQTKRYSENDNDEIPNEILSNFLNTNKNIKHATNIDAISGFPVQCRHAHLRRVLETEKTIQHYHSH